MFEIIGEITSVELIAKGSGIKTLPLIRRKYGPGNWRKMKGIARIQLPNGNQRKRSYIGMKHMESGKKSSKSNASSTKKQPSIVLGFGTPEVKYGVCVENSGYVDLIPKRIYRVKRDKAANAEGMLRIIDESGEDYLYPLSYFEPVLVQPKAILRLRRLQ